MIACNAEIVEEQRTCMAVPAYPYQGACEYGHQITGDACEPCLMSARPGCLTCWNSNRPHLCPVMFAATIRRAAS